MLVVVLLGALLSRLWFVQVLAGSRFSALAEGNAVQAVFTDAPRGLILASSGEPLVANRPAETVVVDRQQVLDANLQPRDDRRHVLADLARLLGTGEDELLQTLQSRRFSRFAPVPVMTDVPPQVRLYLEEHREFFPGVDVVRLPVRVYPQGETAAHVLGFTAEISEQELSSERFAEHRPGELVGKAGLERTYEAELQGQEGLRRLEVNAQGTVVDVVTDEPPVPGADLVTTLDLDLQKATEQVLEEGIVASRSVRRDDGRTLASSAGAAVVLDPDTGGVLAMASYPTFDPGIFTDGLTTTEADALFVGPEDGEIPAINRAVQAAYPPGSVFKTVTGAAFLDAGLIDTGSTVACPPSWDLGGITFRNWNRVAEGSLDLADALMRSCDTFFYELAYQQYVREEQALDAGDDVTEQLAATAEAFGFGRRLGIDLPAEQPGIVPGREWKVDYWERTRDTSCAAAETATDPYAVQLYTELCTDGYRWRGGDAVNASIGQGDVLATPLQVAASYAAIANGGRLLQPHVGDRVVAADGGVRRIEPRVLGELPLDEAQLAELRTGLERVVMNERGTGRGAFDGFPLGQVPVAGKTGTAELGERIPFAWFATYAPADDPRYVIAVAVEEGGGGSQTAAPIARRILEHALGLPSTPFEAGPAILD